MNFLHKYGTLIQYAILILVVGFLATEVRGDTVVDYLDNCIDVDNQDQLDHDLDGFGTACDMDFNNDLTTGFPDLRYYFSDEFNLTTWISYFGDSPGPSGLACAGAIECKVTPVTTEEVTFTWTPVIVPDWTIRYEIYGKVNDGESEFYGITNTNDFTVTLAINEAITLNVIAYILFDNVDIRSEESGWGEIAVREE